MSWPEVFCGSEAVTAGLVTWGRLRGPSFVRIFPDVYVPAGPRPPDLALRSRAAAALVGDRGVVSGYSAAELLGASSGRAGAPAEVTLLRGRCRTHPGLLVHRDRVAPGELSSVGDVQVTGPFRTAWDLARRPGLVEAVVAVDRLANRYRFSPDRLLGFTVHYPRARGNQQVFDVLAHTNRYSGSPMETRLRMLLIGADLPRPKVQWVVPDLASRTAVWLDLAYPDAMIGIEYEGEQHATVEGALRDVGRGRRIYRYTKYDIRDEPDRIIAEVGRGLARERNAIAVRGAAGSNDVPFTRDGR